MRDPGGLLSPPAQEYVQSEPARTPAAVASPGRWSEARPKLQSVSKTASPAKNAPNLAPSCGGAPRGTTSRGANPRAVGAHLKLARAGLHPSNCTGDGRTLPHGPS